MTYGVTVIWASPRFGIPFSYYLSDLGQGQGQGDAHITVTAGVSRTGSFEHPRMAWERKHIELSVERALFVVFYVHMKQRFLKTQLSYKGGGPSCSKLGQCKKPEPDKSPSTVIHWIVIYPVNSVIHFLCVNLLCGSESMAQLLYKTLRLTIFLDK